mgnify:CR=1 FL=1
MKAMISRNMVKIGHLKQKHQFFEEITSLISFYFNIFNIYSYYFIRRISKPRWICPYPFSSHSRNPFNSSMEFKPLPR